MKYLFVCTYNQNRSVKAAELFSELLKTHKLKGEVKSAGVSESAHTKLSKELIEWANKIFVMEQFHKDIITKMVPSSEHKIKVLEILDLYPIGDPLLEKLLKDALKKELPYQ